MSRLEILSRYSDRFLVSPSLIQRHLADLIPEALVKRVREEFYNPLVLEMATCVLFAISDASTSHVPINERIRHWFRDLEQIGGETVEGYAMRADLGPIEDTFILKAPRDPSKSDLVHELFVGLYGTNQLRMVLPNFAYVFGGFDCSIPIIQPPFVAINDDEVKRDKVEVVSYCEPGPDKLVPYVIYENITPAVSLTRFVETCSAEEFFLIIRQLILALRKAWLSIGFVHNDLHSENVLIRQLAETFSFPYSGPQGTEYITTNRVATVIDIGSSHIIYQGRHYGLTGLERFGVFEDLSLPIFDVYKVIFFSLFVMISKNQLAYNEAKKLVPYFHPELNPDSPTFDTEVHHILKRERRRYFYYLTLSPEDRDAFYRLAKEFQSRGVIEGNYPDRWIRAIRFDYDDFLLYMSGHCQCSFITKEPLARLAYSQEEKYGHPLEILESFFERPFDQFPTAENFFEFYDLHTNRTLGQAFREKLIDGFEKIYENALDEYLIELRSKVTKFLNNVANIDPELSLVNLSLMTIINIAGIYRERFTRIAEAISNWRELSFMVEVGEYIANVYQDENLRREIQNQAERFRFYRPLLIAYVDVLVDDRRHLLYLLEKETILEEDIIDPDVSWLRLIFPAAVDILEVPLE